MVAAVDTMDVTATTTTGKSCWGCGRGGSGGGGLSSPTRATVSILSTGVPKASDAEAGVRALRPPTIAASCASLSASTEAVMITEPTSTLTCTRDTLTPNQEAMRGRITAASKLPMSWSRVITNVTT